MALSRAVRFRWLEAQLTTKECHQFMNKLLNQNRNIIMEALFNQISKNTNASQNNGNQINNIISEIIQSRDKKPKPIAIQNIKLDQLPKGLIGIIASFLENDNYISFSLTNRFIYLGCNSPNMLQELDLCETKNYSTINLKLFRSLNYLGLTLTQCEELIPQINDLSHMNELKIITIDAEGKADANINAFLKSNINTNNITQLSLVEFGNNNDWFSTDKFMKLLTKFPNIKYLELDGVLVDININSFKRLYPNLKGLVINGVINHLGTELIETFGSHLDFLAFSEYDSPRVFENINFSQLEELSVMIPTHKSLNDILKTAKHLKKIAIGTNLPSEENTWISLKEMEHVTSNIIILCKELEFMQFRDNGKFLMAILNGIEKGLFETKTLKRNEMKLHIIIENNSNVGNDFKPTFNIGKIIGLLNNSEINDWMFIWELRNLNDALHKSILLQLKKGYSSLNIANGVFGTYFAITNSECKINGFNETWKLDGWCL